AGVVTGICLGFGLEVKEHGRQGERAELSVSKKLQDQFQEPQLRLLLARQGRLPRQRRRQQRRRRGLTRRPARQLRCHPLRRTKNSKQAGDEMWAIQGNQERLIVDREEYGRLINSILSFI